MNTIKKLVSICQYYINSKTIYDIHSPFLYDCLGYIHDSKRYYYDFLYLEAEREKFLRNQDLIERQDFGAGSQVLGDRVSIAEIAKTSLSTKRECMRMYRLAVYLRPRRILELGTSLGVSTAYLAKANPEAEVITVEADAEILAVAKEMWQKLGIENIKPIRAEFDEVLPELKNSFELVFLDGNHVYEATMKYFHHVLQHNRGDICLIADDIHWSEEMERAWEEMKRDPRIDAGIDLYSQGILFKREAFHDKFDISFIPNRYKPWRLGFFSGN